MNELSAVNEAAQAAANSGGVGSSLSTIAAGIVAVIVAAFPVMKVLDKWSVTKTNSEKSDAESTLYKSLKEQIESNSQDIKALQDERNALMIESNGLKARLIHLEAVEKENTRLRNRLEEKDDQIGKLVSEIFSKNHEISDLRERVHQLELRIARDEKEWCADCEKRPK